MGSLGADHFHGFKLLTFAVATALAALPAQAQDTPDEAWSCTAYNRTPGDLGFLAQPIRYWQEGEEGFSMETGMKSDGEIKQMPFRSNGSWWIWTLPSSTSDNELILAIDGSTGRGSMLSESTDYALPAVNFACRWEPMGAAGPFKRPTD